MLIGDLVHVLIPREILFEAVWYDVGGLLFYPFTVSLVKDSEIDHKEA